MGAKKDPRIAIVVELMLQTRAERARRLVEVRDMRRTEGRVSIAQEAEAIIAALDKYDASVWDAMLAITDEERAAIAKAEG